MEKVIRYRHHGVLMNVLEANQGKHRDNCLCWQGCKYFKPDTPLNCPIAQELYELDVKNELVTPVWECKLFER